MEQVALPSNYEVIRLHILSGAELTRNLLGEQFAFAHIATFSPPVLDSVAVIPSLIAPTAE